MFVGGPVYASVYRYTSLAIAVHFYYIFDKVFKNEQS